MTPRSRFIWILMLCLLVPSVTWAASQMEVVARNLTTNTTTAIFTVPSGYKSFHAEAVCSSGACTQTIAINGTFAPTATNGILLCTITLSGTPRAQDACPVITAEFPWYYIVTTATTGTGASGTTSVGYSQ